MANIYGLVVQSHLFLDVHLNFIDILAKFQSFSTPVVFTTSSPDWLAIICIEENETALCRLIGLLLQLEERIESIQNL